MTRPSHFRRSHAGMPHVLTASPAKNMREMTARLLVLADSIAILERYLYLKQRAIGRSGAAARFKGGRELRALHTRLDDQSASSRPAAHVAVALKRRLDHPSLAARLSRLPDAAEKLTEERAESLAAALGYQLRSVRSGLEKQLGEYGDDLRRIMAGVLSEMRIARRAQRCVTRSPAPLKVTAHEDGRAHASIAAVACALQLMRCAMVLI
jgi:hypothetical protein